MIGGESTSDSGIPPGAAAGTGSSPPRSGTPTSILTEEPTERFDDDDHADDAVYAAAGEPPLCPRGLAAIPLLCAAASEPREAYLERLRTTHPSDGWWARQEPLCLDLTNPLSLPERLLIHFAALVERVSLLAGEYMGMGRLLSPMSPRVLQSFLWPIHNVLLCCWIALILTLTYLGSMWRMSQTLLWGAKRTNAPLVEVFLGEVQPTARAVESLCEEHQVLGVRSAGLALMPLMILCDISTSLAGKTGVAVGGLVFVGMGWCAWWYWLCVLPWLGWCGLWLAAMSGGCHGLIEAAPRPDVAASVGGRRTPGNRHADYHSDSF